MSTAKTGSLQERTRRITVKLFWWTAAWVVTLAIATFGPHFIWASRTMTLGAIAINLAAGAGMILANKDHLQILDEMQRKIQLEAMALADVVAVMRSARVVQVGPPLDIYECPVDLFVASFVEYHIAFHAEALWR